MEFAVATGSTPDVVGISVEPKADTNKLIPAAAYCDLIAERCVSFKEAHACAFEIKMHSTDKRGANYIIPWAFKQEKCEVPMHH